MSDPKTNGPDFTARVQATWDAAAAGWDSSVALIREWLRDATAAMLEAANVQPGHRVLDVAAGAGDQTIDVSRRIGPTGHVLAIDLSPQLVARAKVNLAKAGCVNALVRVGNGEALGLDGTFDAAICRLGLMFYADPRAGLIEMRAALKSGGHAAVLVFSGSDRNPLIVDAIAIAARHAGLPAPDPRKPGGLLSLGDPAGLKDHFAEAGFRDVQCRTLAAPLCLPKAADYVSFLRTSAGPIMSLAQGLKPPQLVHLWTDLEAAFSRYQNPDGWRGPNEMLLCWARA